MCAAFSARAQNPDAAPAAPRSPAARIAPDISVVGDLIGDLSPKGSTQENRARLGVREVELAVQAVVDPYFKGVVYFGFNPVEGASVEQAYLTTTSLPWDLEARLGRFLMPVGKQNTTHRHDLHTVEYPYILQRFLGAEGLKGSGVSVSKVLAPLGFYQELILTAVDRFGEPPEGLTAESSPNKQLDGMGYAARLRNYWDLSQAANLELSASAITGKREQPLPHRFAAADPDVNAGLARQNVVGVDLTYRWRPLQQGLYKSFILQGEFLRQTTGVAAYPPMTEITNGFAPGDHVVPRTVLRNGGYVFARWQIGRRLFVGARYDNVQDPDFDGATTTAGSGVLQWYPSEFSKMVASFERVMPGSGAAYNRLLLQATFAIGPHKPHPF